MEYFWAIRLWADRMCLRRVGVGVMVDIFGNLTRGTKEDIRMGGKVFLSGSCFPFLLHLTTIYLEGVGVD